MRNSVENVVQTPSITVDALGSSYEAMETSETVQSVVMAENVDGEVPAEMRDNLVVSHEIDSETYGLRMEVAYPETNRDINDQSTSSLIENARISEDSVASEIPLNTPICLNSGRDSSYTNDTICENPEIPMENIDAVENMCEPVMENQNCPEEMISNVVAPQATRSRDSIQVQEVPNIGSDGQNEAGEWSRTVAAKRSDNWDAIFARTTVSKEESSSATPIPKIGTIVCPKSVKRAGPYILGPLIGTSPVKSVVQCLARKANTDKFYTIEILTLKDDNEYETQDDLQGKMLLHAEYSLLSLLHNQDGVVHHHGFFKASFSHCTSESIVPNFTFCSVSY